MPLFLSKVFVFCYIFSTYETTRFQLVPFLPTCFRCNIYTHTNSLPLIVSFNWVNRLLFWACTTQNISMCQVPMSIGSCMCIVCKYLFCISIPATFNENCNFDIRHFILCSKIDCVVFSVIQGMQQLHCLSPCITDPN